MRKTISLLLCALMTLSLCCFGVSAADGTAVKTEEEFWAMDPNGTYYLDADITLSASYGTAFTGTLDGNGHTLTVNGSPVFDVLQGTVKNLTINGKVTGGSSVGGLAGTGCGVTVTNVTNNADVTSTGSAYVGGLIGGVTTGTGTKDAFQQSVFTDCVNTGTLHAGNKSPRLGGMVGNSAKYQFTTFTNCVNNGKIDVYQDTGAEALGTHLLGGMVGGIFHGKIVNCVNNADLTTTSTGSVGGMIGVSIPSTQQADHSITCISCTNNGNLTSFGRGVGGMAGNCGVKLESGAFAVHTFDKCVNNGNISQTGTSSCYAGGIIGYIYGQNYKEGASYQYGVVTNCVNYGTITTKQTSAGSGTPWASQIIGYTNTTSTTVKDCVGLGKVVTDDDTRSVFVGLSSSDSTQYAVSGVKLVENDGTKQFSWCADSTNGANDHNRIALADRPAGMIDIVSKAAAEDAVKALGEIGYIDPNAPATPDTPDTPDTPVTPDTPDTPVTPDHPNDPVTPVQTADSVVYFVAAALVAVLGAALVSRRITER